MDNEAVLERIRPACESVLRQRGLELVELTLGPQARGRVLRVTVDREGDSVTLDEIASASEEISRALDREDPIEGSYTLEVASPGIERPLLRPADYERFESKQIRVRTAPSIEGRRNFKGRIVRSGEESFVLDVDDFGVVEIPYVTVAKANLVADWDQELKRRR